MKMRSFVLAAAMLTAAGSVSYAADMPVKARGVSPVPYALNWTGFYVGAHVGAGWGTSEQSNYTVGGGPVPAGNDQVNVNGFLGGLQGGYNYQMNPWLVVGVEGDITWTDIKGTNGCLAPIVGGLNCGGKAKWTGDVAARLGFASGNALFYVKGGIAWVNADYTISRVPAPLSATTNTTRAGALLGMGVEYAFDRNWTAKLEYNYIDLQNKTISYNTTPIFGAVATADSRTNINLVKFGVNYRF